MKRVFDGLSLIAIGFVLLACTTGYLHWSVWISIFSLWPLLLVSAGIDIIGKATDRDWLRALSSVVFIGGLLYGAFVMPAGTWGLPWSVGGAGAAVLVERAARLRGHGGRRQSRGRRDTPVAEGRLRPGDRPGDGAAGRGSDAALLGQRIRGGRGRLAAAADRRMGRRRAARAARRHARPGRPVDVGRRQRGGDAGRHRPARPERRGLQRQVRRLRADRHVRRAEARDAGGHLRGCGAPSPCGYRATPG